MQSKPPSAWVTLACGLLLIAAFVYPPEGATERAYAQDVVVESTIDFPVGQTFVIDFGESTYSMFFESEEQLTYTGLTGVAVGQTNTVELGVRPFREGLYIVYWQEPDTTTVVQIYDFVNGLVNSSTTTPEGVFMNNTGTVIPSDVAALPVGP